jgi:hypothetical protein
MRLDFGYQNGVRGFIHSVSLRRDLPQAEALAYTAECIHAHYALAEITGNFSWKGCSPRNGSASCL